MKYYSSGSLIFLKSLRVFTYSIHQIIFHKKRGCTYSICHIQRGLAQKTWKNSTAVSTAFVRFSNYDPHHHCRIASSSLTRLTCHHIRQARDTRPCQFGTKFELNEHEIMKCHLHYNQKPINWLAGGGPSALLTLYLWSYCSDIFCYILIGSKA